MPEVNPEHPSVPLIILQAATGRVYLVASADVEHIALRGTYARLDEALDITASVRQIGSDTGIDPAALTLLDDQGTPIVDGASKPKIETPSDDLDGIIRLQAARAAASFEVAAMDRSALSHTGRAEIAPIGQRYYVEMAGASHDITDQLNAVLGAVAELPQPRYRGQPIYSGERYDLKMNLRGATSYVTSGETPEQGLAQPVIASMRPPAEERPPRAARDLAGQLDLLRSLGVPVAVLTSRRDGMVTEVHVPNGLIATPARGRHKRELKAAVKGEMAALGIFSEPGSSSPFEAGAPLDSDRVEYDTPYGPLRVVFEPIGRWQELRQSVELDTVHGMQLGILQASPPAALDPKANVQGARRRVQLPNEPDGGDATDASAQPAPERGNAAKRPGLRPPGRRRPTDRRDGPAGGPLGPR